MQQTIREQCAPADADWFVNVIYGKTHCPEHGPLCEYDSCQHRYGTNTDYSYAYYKGERPDESEAASLVPADHYVLELEIKRCPEIGDESECAHCDAPIRFTSDYPRWQTPEGAGECDRSETGEHEPNREYHE